jgi:hypothetical protein
MDMRMPHLSSGRSMHKPLQPPRLTRQLRSNTNRCGNVQALDIQVSMHIMQAMPALYLRRGAMSSGSRLTVG